MELTDDERATLQRWARRPKSLQALALRSRIVLACADGLPNTVVAEQLGVNKVTVGKWRARFVEHRLEGLSDEPRPGAPRTVTDERVEAVIVKTLEVAACPRHALVDPLDGRGDRHEPKCGVADLAGVRAQAAQAGDVQAVHRCTVRGEGPRRGGPAYLNPPEKALVLCVDEKTQVQALNRSSPVLPMMPGTPERVTHDYIRAGALDLFAALAVAGPTAGQVITQIHAQHRAVEFRKFLLTIDKTVPARLDVHLICDNLATHKTPTVKKWLLAHPRFHIHFTPTGSSWLNLVERWFAEITVKLIRRGVHHSVKQLAADITAWADNWNANPKPYVWTKTADQILNPSPHFQRINDSQH